MSKKENKKTISERVKLWIANKALRVAESMLAKERPAHIDPDKPKQPKQPKEIRTPNPVNSQLNVRTSIDHDFSERGELKGELDMKEFYQDMTAMVAFHLEKKSALTVAGPLMAHALRIYKSVLPDEEYDDILWHVYESRGMIEPLTLPQEEEKKKSTIH